MFENKISSLNYLDKVDLEQKNHLSGKKAKFLKLSFKKIEDLQEVKRELSFISKRTREDITKKEDKSNFFQMNSNR